VSEEKLSKIFAEVGPETTSYENAEIILGKLLEGADGKPTIEDVRRGLVKRYGEDIAQETLLRLIGNIARGKLPPNILAYIWVIARNVFREYLRENRDSSTKVGNVNLYDVTSGELTLTLGDLAHITTPAHLETLVQEQEEEIKNRCLKKCLAKLDPDERKFLEGYLEAKNKGEYSERHGLTPQEGAIKKHQIKEQLKQCCERCLQKHLWRE
jgi:RNA polymerase sigma factor (sigma-70 family)